MLWTIKDGFWYLEEHLKRLRNSHEYFKWGWDEEKIRSKLKNELQVLSAGEVARVRLRTSQKGEIFVDVFPLEHIGWGKNLLKIKISAEKTRSKDLFLFHKTTNRSFYNDQFKQAISEGYDEVIFINEKSEVTEGAISNIFIRKDNKWLTPPVKCGLLPGVWRAAKITELNAEARILYIEDLEKADEVMIGNSVRGEGKAVIR